MSWSKQQNHSSGDLAEHTDSKRRAEVCVGSDAWESHVKLSAKSCIVAAHSAVRAHTYIHTSRQMGRTGEQEGRQTAGHTDKQTDRQAGGQTVGG